MSWERMTAIGPAGENRWSRWRRLLVPSLFFAGVIYYEELFLKLFCFHAVTPVGALSLFFFFLPSRGFLHNFFSFFFIFLFILS